MKDSRALDSGQFAGRFFLVAIAVFAVAGLLAFALIRHSSAVASRGPIFFPPALGASTLLLLGGSGALQRALTHVRRERQASFRRSLVVALMLGTAFVGAQTYGLWSLAAQRPMASASTDARPFLVTAAVLHGIHFSLALLFLVYVTLRGLNDRYDHEYHWGVTVCAWFWHVLCAVWLLILAALVIAVVY